MTFEEFQSKVKTRVNEMRYSHNTDEEVANVIESQSGLIQDGFNDDPTDDGADYIAREIVSYYL